MWKRKFTSLDKPHKKGLWKIEPRGLFSEFYGNYNFMKEGV